MINPRDILDFWFGHPTSPDYGQPQAYWFKKSDTFDAEIRSKFEPVLMDYLQHKETIQLDCPQDYLATIILLDQFTRNMYRNTPKAFEMDSEALNLARECIDKGYYQQLPPFQKTFILLPLMHAEDLAMQTLCVDMAKDLGNPQTIDYAIQHKNIIEKFHRFPHRNQILGRASTKEEQEFLTQPNSSF